jgi:hypothetical protein
MTEPAVPTGRTTVGPPATDDWPVQAADAIERAVGTVRDKTTGPAITVGRALVYGTFAAIAGIAAAVMLAIAAVRGLDIAATELIGDGHTWAAHLVVGVVFSLAGMLAWSKRQPRSST